MLADRCYPVISGARDVVTSETDASYRAEKICNSVIVTISDAKWLDCAFSRRPVQFCRSTAVQL